MVLVLGGLQWTYDRCVNLINVYTDIAGTSDTINYLQTKQAEARHMSNELLSAYYYRVYTYWISICANENKSLDLAKSAYWAGWCSVIGYGLDPGNIHLEIYNPNSSTNYVDMNVDYIPAWHAIAVTRGNEAEALYGHLI